MIWLKGGNRKQLLFVALIMIGLFIVASCTAIQQQQAYHSTLMKGSIIHTTDAGVYLCIGKEDGASIGQELYVYRITNAGKTATPIFQKEKIGKVKITEIVDEHFATAVIVSGKAEKNDIVELAH